MRGCGRIGGAANRSRSSGRDLAAFASADLRRRRPNLARDSLPSLCQIDSMSHGIAFKRNWHGGHFGGRGHLVRIFTNVIKGKWRRRRDSNPRDGFPPTPLAGERLRPLGHVSADAYSQGNIGNTRRFCPFSEKPFHTRKPAQVALRGTEEHRVWARSGQFPLQKKRPRTRQAFCEAAQAERALESAKVVSGQVCTIRSPFQKEVGT